MEPSKAPKKRTFKSDPRVPDVADPLHKFATQKALIHNCIAMKKAEGNPSVFKGQNTYIYTCGCAKGPSKAGTDVHMLIERGSDAYIYQGVSDGVNRPIIRFHWKLGPWVQGKKGQVVKVPDGEELEKANAFRLGMGERGDL